MWDESLELTEISGDSLHVCALISPLSTLAKIADAPKVWNLSINQNWLIKYTKYTM
jgi:hypothetical protein